MKNSFIRVNGIKLIVFLLLSIFVCCTSYAQIDYKKKIIHNRHSAYWDRDDGYWYSWHLNRNGMGAWYHSEDKKRYLADFDDFIIDHFHWNVKQDTLFFYLDYSKKPCEKYLILDIDNKIMKVCEIERGDYYGEPFVLKYSKNQIRKPKPIQKYKTYKYDFLTKTNKRVKKEKCNWHID